MALIRTAGLTKDFGIEKGVPQGDATSDKRIDQTAKADRR